MSFAVLISVYKKESYSNLDRAMQSIWDDQTLKPGQIVLVKDGSLNEDLNKVIGRWQVKLNSILRVIGIKKNVGLAKALNRGLPHCDFELVARMDTDDISLPNRFEKQIRFMERNPSIAVSSSWIEEIDEKGNSVSLRKVPISHSEILNFAKSRNPISHPAAIFRKSAVVSVGGYPEFRKSQDYALWSLMLQEGYEFANIPEVLLKMRTGSKMMRRRGLGYFFSEYEIFKFQKKIGFLSCGQFIINTFSRFLLRLSPNPIKNFFYKNLRN